MHQRSLDISTAQLSKQLTHLYTRLKSNEKLSARMKHFYGLWDLKELALINQQETIKIPVSWLQEIESVEKSITSQSWLSE